MILCFLFNPVQEYGLSLLNDGATGMNLRSMLCALLLLCYYTFLTFILGSAKNQVFLKIIPTRRLCYIICPFYPLRDRRGRGGGS